MVMGDDAEEEIRKSIKLVQRINNYPGVDKLTKLVKKAAPEITKAQVKHFLMHDTTTQLMKIQPKRKAEGHIVAFSANECWQMDIFDMSRYQLSNNGYKFILVCVDVFSRKAYAQPMRTKMVTEVESAFLKIITESNKPNIILSDHEGAFLSNSFDRLLMSRKIILNVNIVGDHHALGIIDSFARRIKVIFTSIFLEYKTTNWIEHLQRVVDIYNRSENAAINNMSPNDAMMKSNQWPILKLNLEKNVHNKTVSDLNIGDKVRKSVMITDKAITKGTDPRWSETVYTVTKAMGNTILLNDGSRFKRTNLLQVPQETVSTPINPIAEIKRRMQEKQH
jgi:transposase InsO family protein